MVKVCAKSFQSCPTLWNAMDHSLPGSSVWGVLQAIILKWVVMPFSGGSSWPRIWTLVLFPALRDGFFTINTIREAYISSISFYFCLINFLVWSTFSLFLPFLTYLKFNGCQICWCNVVTDGQIKGQLYSHHWGHMVNNRVKVFAVMNFIFWWRQIDYQPTEK